MSEDQETELSLSPFETWLESKVAALAVTIAETIKEEGADCETEEVVDGAIDYSDLYFAPMQRILAGAPWWAVDDALKSEMAPRSRAPRSRAQLVEAVLKILVENHFRDEGIGDLETYKELDAAVSAKLEELADEVTQATQGAFILTDEGAFRTVLESRGYVFEWAEGLSDEVKEWEDMGAWETWLGLAEAEWRSGNPSRIELAGFELNNERSE